MDKKGFALAETLIAVMFVALSGLLIAGALNVSVNSYDSIKSESNARVLADEYLIKIREIVKESSFESNTSDLVGSKTACSSASFYCNKYGARGSFISKNGAIVFKTEGKVHYLISRREMATGINEDEKLLAEISYKIVDKKCISGTLIVKTEDEKIKIEKAFCFYPSEVITC